MSTLMGVFAIGLMVVVLLIAAFSLLFVSSLPLARWRQRRRNSNRPG